MHATDSVMDPGLAFTVMSTVGLLITEALVMRSDLPWGRTWWGWGALFLMRTPKPQQEKHVICFYYPCMRAMKERQKLLHVLEIQKHVDLGY